MTRTIVCAVALLALLIAQSAEADHPRKKTQEVDGGTVTSESFKTNYFVYRSIGGKTEVKGKKKKRKWWCGWLCKRRVPLKVDSISVQNTYFSEVEPGIFESLVREAKVCFNASSCKQREFAVGFLPQLELDTGGLLPIHGVITVHQTVVDGGAPIPLVTSRGQLELEKEVEETVAEDETPPDGTPPPGAHGPRPRPSTPA